jgi:hypothetical protein
MRMKQGDEGVSQGAEERSSLLSKLLFSRYSGSHKVKFTLYTILNLYEVLYVTIFFLREL